MICKKCGFPNDNNIQCYCYKTFKTALDTIEFIAIISLTCMISSFFIPFQWIKKTLQEERPLPNKPKGHYTQAIKRWTTLGADSHPFENSNEPINTELELELLLKNIAIKND